MTKQLRELKAEVPGIEILEKAPAGAKKYQGPFYPDQAEKLRDELRKVADRSAVVVAPDADGWLNIYWRKAK